MPQLRDDPLWVNARFGQCAGCAASVARMQVLYYPKARKVYGAECCDAAGRNWAEHERTRVA